MKRAQLIMRVVGIVGVIASLTLSFVNQWFFIGAFIFGLLALTQSDVDERPVCTRTISYRDKNGEEIRRLVIDNESELYRASCRDRFFR